MLNLGTMIGCRKPSKKRKQQRRRSSRQNSTTFEHESRLKSHSLRSSPSRVRAPAFGLQVAELPTRTIRALLSARQVTPSMWVSSRDYGCRCREVRVVRLVRSWGHVGSSDIWVTRTSGLMVRCSRDRGCRGARLVRSVWSWGHHDHHDVGAETPPDKEFCLGTTGTCVVEKPCAPSSR